MPLLSLLAAACCLALPRPAVVAAEAAPPLVIRVGTYNVGHFNQGKLGGYQGPDPREAMLRWRHWIQQQAFDLFFIQEWNRHFDKDGTLDATEELLRPLFSDIVFGQENRYIYNGIATDFKLSNPRQVPLTHKEYYLTQADWRLGDVTITLMSVHVPWQQCCHESSIDALIAELRRHKYFICSGDLNAPDRNVLKIKAAGIQVANGGDEGWFCTAAARCATAKTDVHIDNILTSTNIVIRKVSAPHIGLSEQDHLPLLAELVIQR